MTANGRQPIIGNARRMRHVRSVSVVCSLTVRKALVSCCFHDANPNRRRARQTVFTRRAPCGPITTAGEQAKASGARRPRAGGIVRTQTEHRTKKGR